MNKSLVMKFGGASVATPAAFASIAAIVDARRKDYQTLAVVVSAMQGTTDQLIALAHSVHVDPPRREYDMLITVGERISCSLLAMALVGRGCEAMSFTGSQAGIITCERHTDATILDVRPHRLMEPFAHGVVAVVAGFQGVSRQGAITTLGRGGSDTTAVALGIAFGAEHVEFYKDVPGIFTNDPKKSTSAQHLSSLTYGEALTLAEMSPMLHPRCLHLASKNAIPLHVRSFKDWDNPKALKTVITSASESSRPNQPVYESL